MNTKSNSTPSAHASKPKNQNSMNIFGSVCINKKLLLNRVLIKEECKELFDFLYAKHFQCIICRDILFDPVLCNECNGVFCRNCVVGTNVNNKVFILLKCNHKSVKTYFR